MQKTPDLLQAGRGARARSALSRGRRPVIGLESEFTLYVQDEKRLPEHIFRNPQEIVRQKMIPRQGRSYHLPSGGAIYFDTGVIEVATPIIELEAGCCIRAVRSLWEQIDFVRRELNEWEKEHGATVRLEGFSTHYNISVPPRHGLDTAGMRRLARLLTYLLHAPVMLLAANKLSTGVGVRPRDHRLEVTVDFTPDPELMVATTALIVGVITSVLQWNDFELAELSRRSFRSSMAFVRKSILHERAFSRDSTAFHRTRLLVIRMQTIWRMKDGRMRSLRQMAYDNRRAVSAPDAGGE